MTTSNATSIDRTTAHNDLEIASLVRHALATVRDAGRFGDRKVFIASLWTMMLTIEGQTGGTLTAGATLEDFKAWLLRSRRITRDGTEEGAPLIVLARADFVAAMDYTVVAASETVTGGATGTLLVVVFGSLGELRALVRDQRTRVIHGLEHACVKMLERRRCKPLSGQTHEGFFEVELANDGRASVEAVELAAELAVARVARGEVALALDRRCGTSLLVGAVVVAMLVVGAAVLGFVEGIQPGALAAGTAVSAVLAWWGARPVGIWAQRALTVSTRFADAQVERVVRVVHASGDAATFRVYVAVELA